MAAAVVVILKRSLTVFWSEDLIFTYTEVVVTQLWDKSLPTLKNQVSNLVIGNSYRANICKKLKKKRTGEMWPDDYIIYTIFGHFLPYYFKDFAKMGSKFCQMLKWLPNILKCCQSGEILLNLLTLAGSNPFKGWILVITYMEDTSNLPWIQNCTSSNIIPIHLPRALYLPT